MKEKKWYIILGILIVVIIVAFTGGKNNSVKAASVPAKNMKQITSIPGLSFQIHEGIVGKATAVTQISEGVGFDKNSYYAYKNGIDEYLLFNMSELVVATQKDTKFDFKNHKDDEETSLGLSSVMGIWMEKDGKKLDIVQTDNGYSATVNAGVTITKDIYGDFTGKLVTITKEGEESSIFVGVPGTKYEDLSSNSKKNIEAIANSIIYSDTVTEENKEEEYAVTISSNKGEAVSENEIKVTDTPENIDVSGNETISDNETISENMTVSDNTTSENEIDVVILPEKEIISENSVVSENKGKEETVSENITVSENESISENETENIVSENAIEKKKNAGNEGMKISNQKDMKRDTNKAYRSSVYSLLSIGDNGLLDTVDRTGINTPIINLRRIYTGADAVNIIKEYSESGSAKYSYFEAPVGCSWHVVVYDLNYENCKEEPYVNVKLRGIDGESLIYRGIKYSKKTHDITNKVGKSGVWNTGYICYYAVPNNCEEYVLECGDGILESKDLKSAYYLIKSK